MLDLCVELPADDTLEDLNELILDDVLVGDELLEGLDEDVGEVNES
jgi:hypothetical protein